MLAGLLAFAQAAYPSRPIRYDRALIRQRGPQIFSDWLVADQPQGRPGANVVVENKTGRRQPRSARRAGRQAPRRTAIHAVDGDLDHARHQQDALQEARPRSRDRILRRSRLVAGVPFALIVNPQIPAQVAAASSSPTPNRSRGWPMSSAGNGSPQHLGAEMLKAASGISITPRALSRQRAGDARRDRRARSPSWWWICSPRWSTSAHGKVRCLGVTRQKRVAAAPEIPTIWPKRGCPDSELVAWQGVVAPAGTAARRSSTSWRRRSQSCWPIAATRDKLKAMSLEPLPAVDAGQFCRLHQDRGRALGRDRQKLGRRARIARAVAMAHCAGAGSVTILGLDADTMAGRRHPMWRRIDLLSRPATADSAQRLRLPRRSRSR